MKKIPFLFVLAVLIAAASIAQGPPVKACGACEDACAYQNSVCYANAYDQYHSCLDDCDTLYPWWGGCPTYCYETRQSSEAQCDTDYANCLTGCP